MQKQALAFRIYCMAVIYIGNSVSAQDLARLRKNSLECSEIAFKASIISRDPLKEKPIIDEKFYHVVMSNGQNREWIHYRIVHLDTQLHHLSVYNPKEASIMVAEYTDTLSTLYQLTHWDSIAPCVQNPPSNSLFALAFPFVGCFYPTAEKLLKMPFKSTDGSWVLKDRHPVLNSKRTVWVNPMTGLADSIHSSYNNGTKDRIIFEYYYLLNSEGRKDFSKTPAFYPLTQENPAVLQILRKPKPIKAILGSDSVAIGRFLRSQGKLLLIDFWFIGCRPCHQTFPALNRLRRDYPENALGIIAFTPFDENLEIFRFKTRNRLRFDMLRDSLGLNLFFQVHAYPCAILINAKGEVLYRHEGLNPKLDVQLRTILDAHIKS